MWLLIPFLLLLPQPVFADDFLEAVEKALRSTEVVEQMLRLKQEAHREAAKSSALSNKHNDLSAACRYRRESCEEYFEHVWVLQRARRAQQHWIYKKQAEVRKIKLRAVWAAINSVLKGQGKPVPIEVTLGQRILEDICQ